MNGLRGIHSFFLLAVALFIVLNHLTGCSRNSYVMPPPSYRVYSPPPAPSGPQTSRMQSAPNIPHTVPRASSPRTDRVEEKCVVRLDAPKTITHEVGPLETLWRLSRMYDVPEEKICAANGIRRNDPIHIGQKLIIPNTRMMRHVIPLYSETRWKYIIIHHTASDFGKATLINRVHEDRGFWRGIGYHFLIDNGTLGKGDGQIEVSPRWIKQMSGAHCKAGGMNETGIGIALVGNFNNDLPTRSQMESLAYLLQTLSRHYQISSAKVMGHRDVTGAATDCPGKRFPWYQVRQCLAGL